MTITRIGSTEQYASNWARAFGENKRGKATVAATTKAVRGKATAAAATKAVRGKAAKKRKASKALSKAKKK